MLLLVEIEIAATATQLNEMRMEMWKSRDAKARESTVMGREMNKITNSIYRARELNKTNFDVYAFAFTFCIDLSFCLPYVPFVPPALECRCISIALPCRAANCFS